VVDPLTIVASLALVAASAVHAFVPREVEFPFDDATRLLPGEHDGGKVWRSPGLTYDGREVPLIVFVHGIIFDGQRHHWLTVDPNGPWDARPFLRSMVEDGSIPPLVAAAPSQTRDATDPGKLFVDLDFDALVDSVDGALAPFQRVDRRRIVVVGHSGSACEPNAGAFAALRSKLALRALFAVDGCLHVDGARLLATANNATDVIVTYQETIWPERPFIEFRAAFRAEMERSWPRGLRMLERFEPVSENAHLALVELTLRRWLPTVLPHTARSWAEAPTIAASL
jgi:hypothetical protein